ncbi:sensor histidine kinase [Neobacillus massiliamazoniensis]|uniref:histidine kinase n=1 Tax=Neobacillus massiliamazoniensis TaxID=1499688 RepID=A0A0U1NU41_9BACI|nr:histidine kinase [Neobacillus massiliamazoniensis]CRK81543.1 sensory transduction protein kinase [Neobacillus massiliamazoniensis]
MELWLIFSKLILIGYLAFSIIHSVVPNASWVVFSILLYLCINVSIYIVKKEIFKKIILFLAIIHILISFYMVHPLFILLLPLNICELATYFIHKKFGLFILVTMPVLLIDDQIRYQYGLAGAFSLLVFIMATMLVTKIENQEAQLDKLRKDLQKLSKNLNENKEFIKQSEYTFKLEERNRLAQVFHDKIGHAMTGALIQMEAAKRLLNTDQGKSGELLQNAINISKEGIENIRTTLKNLKPKAEQMGINRLKLFIEEFSDKHSIQIPLVYQGNIETITPIQWKIIQENVTEALTNALKYAQATVISIELQVLNTMIRVEVKDNGRGVQKITKGLGIIGMEERTAAINGTIIVDGTDGFSVTMLLPVK